MMMVAAVTVRPRWGNAVVVRPHGDYTPARVAEIAQRTLLGQELQLGSTVELLLRAHKCVFEVVRTHPASASGVVGLATSIEVDHEPIAPMHKQPPMDRDGSLESNLADLLSQAFHGTVLRASVGLAPLQGILVTGPEGSGKTTLVRSTCTRMSVTIVELSILDVLAHAVVQGHLGATEAHNRYVNRAQEHVAAAPKPACVHVPDLHLISGPYLGDDDQTQQARPRVARLLCDFIKMQPAQVVVIAESLVRRGALPETLREDTVFGHECIVPQPSVAERLHQLTALFENIPIIQQQHVDDRGAMLTILAQRTAGWSRKDLMRFSRNVLLAACASAQGDGTTHLVGATKRLHLGDDQPSRPLSPLQLPVVDWDQHILPAVALHVPATTAVASWEMINADTPMSSQGFIGYDAVYQRLDRLLTWPLKHQSAYERFQLDQSRGILLFGPPGCGKTLLANTLLATSGVNCVRVRGSDLFSRYLGESERFVRRVFASARQRAPCIVFLDELEAIAIKRDLLGGADGGAAGVHERVLSQLLNEMDGVEERGQVVVLACTNRPDKLDEALLRQGRLDQLVYLDRPQLEDRKSILKSLARRVPTEPNVEDTFWHELASSTDGATGANLTMLYRDCALRALKLARPTSSAVVTRDLLQTAVIALRHRLSARMTAPPNDGDYVQLCDRFARLKGIV